MSKTDLSRFILWTGGTLVLFGGCLLGGCSGSKNELEDIDTESDTNTEIDSNTDTNSESEIDSETETEPPCPARSIQAISGSSLEDVWVAADRAIVHFDGQQWRCEPTMEEDHAIDVWVTAPNDVYLRTKTVERTHRIWHYDGTEWNVAYSVDSGGALRGIWGLAPDNLFVVGDKSREAGLILHFDGLAWSEMELPEVTNPLYAIWGIGPNDIRVRGEGAWLDWDGEHWTGESIQATDQTIGVEIWYDQSHSGYISYYNPFVPTDWLVRFDDSGEERLSLSEEILGKSEYWVSVAIWGSAEDNVYIATANGDDETPLAHFDGEKWTAPLWAKPGFWAVWGLSAKDVFAGTKNGLIYQLKEGTWVLVYG